MNEEERWDDTKENGSNIPSSEPDWTVNPLDGRCNSSEMFNMLVVEVGKLIRGDAHTLLNGHADSTARLIVAQLAHKYKLQPNLQAVHDERQEAIDAIEAEFLKIPNVPFAKANVVVHVTTDYTSDEPLRDDGTLGNGTLEDLQPIFDAESDMIDRFPTIHFDFNSKRVGKICNDEDDEDDE
jgi:hypothetical protein